MAGGDDDDYMGDISLFLPPEDDSSSKKKFGTNMKEPLSAPKPKRPKTRMSLQEQRKLDKERRLREEDDQTNARLEAAIPETNLGFRMLHQMGYNPGMALGKDGSGRVEPLRLEIRRSRAGIGRETPAEMVARKEREAAEKLRRREEEMMAEFGSRRRSQWREKRIAGDYRKAEAALAQLENREVVEAKNEEGDEKKRAEDEEEEEELITEEDLFEMLMKLREEHRYCLYCGCQYESVEALQTDCPGLYEDH